MASLNMRIDEELKKQAEKVLGEMGMTLTTAIVIYLRQVVREREIPFTIKVQ